LTFGGGGNISGVKGMAVPQLRTENPPAAEAFAGVRVKIDANNYLVGLTRSDAGERKNLELLSTRNWFDLPIILSDGRPAKLTFEKSRYGGNVIDDALAAWK
jgi:hypothetical protein